jgi:D-sedoheptulose 7-phosphate isomerase
MTLESLLQSFPQLERCRTAIEQAVQLVCTAYDSGGKVLTCGNGGSAADAEHIVGELMKGFLSTRPLSDADRRALIDAAGDDGAYLAEHLQMPLPAISLVSSVSLATAFANDVAPELTFAQQVYGLGRAGDVLIALSTSGNSRNVVYAVHAARARGLRTIGLTGGTGGRLKELSDVALVMPASETPAIQELHLPVYHYICAAAEAHAFGEQ